MDITVLGATGSIGTQTLDVVRSCLPDARIRALTGYSNIKLLADMVNEFKPEAVCVPSGDSAKQLQALTNTPCEILTGEEGLISCAAETGSSIVVNALVGRAGLAPTLAAIEAGKNIALANKETLVSAGGIIMSAAQKKGVSIIPIDSEHSAILQCLEGADLGSVEKLILTASGGPFSAWQKDKIKKAKAADALKHPNWAMGKKITIDSATMMNKGLELIEAMWLFAKPAEDIDIYVHPQSIVHSMVQFTDGVIMAQMGPPDMRLPILYALAGPSRVTNDFPRLNFFEKGLTFEPVDTNRFPCLDLAKKAAIIGGTLPVVMNTVNEWAVGQFLQDKLDFYGISALIAKAFDSYTVKEVKSLSDVYEAEDWAMEFVGNI